MSAPTPPSGGGIPGPGYYPDPSIPGYVRYWNGAAWVPGTSRRAQEGEEEPAATAEGRESAGGTEGPAGTGSPEGTEGPADAPPAAASGPSPSETGPVFLDEEEPLDAPPAPRGRHARGGAQDDVRDDVRDAAEAAAAAGEPADAQGAWQAVDVVDVAERADSRVAWGARDPQEPPALTVPAELGGGAPDPARAEEEPRVPGARRAGESAAEQEGGQAAPGAYDEDRPGVPLGRDPRVGGGSWGEQVRRLAGPAPVPAPAAPEETREPGPTGRGEAGADSGFGAADPRQAAGGYAPSPTEPDVPHALPAPATPEPPQARPAPTAPDVPVSPPPSPGTPELPQPRPAQPQLAPQGGHAAPPLTPAARTAPPAAPQQPPAAQLPERAARAELPQGGGAGAGEPPVVPWRPPTEDPFLSAAQGTAPPAGLGRRLGARLVDALLVGGVVAAVAVPLVSKSVDHVQDKIDAAEESGKTVTVWLVDGTTGPYLALVLGLFLVLGLIVEALPTAKWGRTPGKRLFGVRVLDIESQDPPATGSALRRWLTYAVFLLLPLIGLVNVIWCAFDKPWRQCWHDKAGRTYVARG
ncbi:RDD family protein [Streptomyces sp. WMMC500]|uniref:RDD family protein n=1 Tax=Streptomyces sp. WMMC500 TaxID=3015154 RepID=UPI00248BCEBD|nr:RDD family protein [Streptomyces sp. WMMC500]WBB59089.1 RDD family protein [Streptomyces sp. WMMC500]